MVNETGTVSLAGAISGAGVVTQKGSGVTILGGASTYTGGTKISRGILEVTRSPALGSGGTITMTGGEFLATANVNLAQSFSFTGTTAIAVATGSTMTLNSASVGLGAGTTYIGDATHAGTVIWNISSSITTVANSHLEIRDGTLKMGTGLASSLTSLLAPLRVDAGATLDLGGNSAIIKFLTGTGVVTDSGAAATVSLEGATTFGGVFSGHVTEIDVFDTTTLTGNQTFTGKAVLENTIDLTLSGLFAETVQFNGAETLVLAVPSRFTGTIQGFQSGSTVDLKNITTGAAASLAYNATTGVLTVKDGTHTDTVKFGSGLVLGNFMAAADGSGGTDIDWQTPPAGPRGRPGSPDRGQGAGEQ